MLFELRGGVLFLFGIGTEFPYQAEVIVQLLRGDIEIGRRGLQTMPVAQELKSEGSELPRRRRMTAVACRTRQS